MRNFSLIVTIISVLSISPSYAVQSTLSKTQDMGLINKERIIYWLEKRGEIPLGASEQDKQQALERYIMEGNSLNRHLKGDMAAFVLNSHKNTLAKMSQTQSTSKNQPSKSSSTSNAQEVADTTVKVLAIMVDFQDLKYNNNGLSSKDTDMFYNDYSVQHYNDLLFSTDGFDGPTGQNIQSAYQYYQSESGNGLSFTGNTFGWITAQNNAAYYGENNDDDNDEKVGELVIEAITKAIADHNIDLDDYDKSDFFDIDQDGNIHEPDGIVDHIMIFHSGIGEEAGGGSLGTDAIWSHRFFVFDNNNQPLSVPGSSTKIYGYTITPIDSSPGVVVHEFGHDLGLPDEYDTNISTIDSPVGAWSVMASGSWVGSPRGTSPVSFSPYAKEYLQTRYNGSWINQQVLNFTDFSEETISLIPATDHSGGINQIKVTLPNTPIEFGAPYSGSYQYYSNRGHELENKLSFTTTVGLSTNTLRMKARWDIEKDWDYVLVKANNQVLSGNHTTFSNPHHFLLRNYISGQSTSIAGASTDGWVELTFDLTNFSNQTVTFEIEYITDQAEGGYGFVIDDITVTSGSNTTFTNGAETTDSVTLAGFNRISNTVEGKDQNYYVQLRNHSSTDSELSSLGYDPGILVWLKNENIDDNNSSQHAGEVLIGVIDADQNLIRSGDVISPTELQLRDAAFSLYQQSWYPNDSTRTNNSIFIDTNDYSSSEQPESGLNLPEVGFQLEVISQATDSSSATVFVSKGDQLNGTFIHSTNNLSISLTSTVTGGNEPYQYLWNFGDTNTSTDASPTHTFSTAGSYTVSLTITDADNNTVNVTNNVSVSLVSTNNESEGGGGSITWLLLGLIVVRIIKSHKGLTY